MNKNLKQSKTVCLNQYDPKKLNSHVSTPSVVVQSVRDFSLIGRRVEMGENQNLNLKFEEVLKNVFKIEKRQKKF